jgi:HPt (histidine-containing phosphotransfer) domain-containing protein
LAKSGALLETLLSFGLHGNLALGTLVWQTWSWHSMTTVTTKTTLAEFEYFLSTHDGDFESAFDELDALIGELRLDMASLDRHTRREDSMTVASIAYRLKSAAKIRGIELLQQSAVQIELSARKNRLGQMAAEIELMRYQVELLARSARLQRESHDVLS